MRQVSHPRLAIAILLSFTGSTWAQSPPPAELKAYTETIPGSSLKFDMVPIPGGTFTMGSPASEADRNEDEGPTFTAKIAPFWMGKCEVTWDEFDEYAFSRDIKRKQRAGVDLEKQSDAEKAADAVTRSTKPYADMTFGFGSRGNPAICMTHHAAMEYCRWLSAITGKTYRLPTEAEWEYAARAGTTTPYSFGDSADDLGEYAWYVENAEQPMKVGKKKPNPWGLHDMHGNVAEWCIDFYMPDAYAAFAKSPQPVAGPVVLPTPKEYAYVARGGSWDDDADKLRSAARVASNLEWSIQDPQRPQSIWWHTDATRVGFRVVRALDEQENLRGVRSLVVKGKGSR
ncbi:formylglycine-generating enzyme family protein [Tundrisphaera lichenicola]|uniref:formylglycine-generating enzyme family protein n=1 Tax=Tundrisphaera lichenicola TaxID=2029860 RepID=UPI003EBE309A